MCITREPLQRDEQGWIMDGLGNPLPRRPVVDGSDECGPHWHDGYWDGTGMVGLGESCRNHHPLLSPHTNHGRVYCLGCGAGIVHEPVDE